MSGESEARVEVNAADLVSALQALRAAQTRGKEIAISFHEGALELARGVTTVRVPATGTWRRVALVPVDFVREVLRRRKELPDTLVVLGGHTTLQVSHYWIRCRWVEPQTE